MIGSAGQLQTSEGNAMSVSKMGNGWQRFLDRLKELWGKRESPGPKPAWS